LARPALSIDRTWWHLISALFSFEAVLLIFLFAGNYNADPRLTWLPVDLSIGFFAIGVAMGAVIIYREGLYLPGLTVVSLFMVFLGWAMLTQLWTPSELYAHQKLLKLTTLNLWSVIAAAVIIANRPERLRRFLLLALVLGTAGAIDGIVQYRTADQFAMSASFALENYQGQARLYGMGVLVAFALWLRTAPFSARGAVLMAAFATCWYGMLIAGARMPAIAVVIGMLPPLALGVRLTERRLLVSRVAVVSLVLLAAMAAVVAHLATVSAGSLRGIQRFDVLLGAEGGGGSVSARLEFWPASLRLWAEAPVFGQGVGGWPMLYYGRDVDWHPHNLVLEVLVEFGLVGFFLLAAVMAAACYRVTAERLRAEPVLMTAAMLCISAFLYAMSSGDLPDNRMLFAVLGLLVLRPTRDVVHAGTGHGRPHPGPVPRPLEVPSGSSRPRAGRR
jgi:O-antigen ligase